MIEWIRHASKPVLWIIVLVVVVSFAFWGDFTPTAPVTGVIVGRIEGRPLDQKTFLTSLREAELGYFLSEGRVAQGAEAERTVRDRAWHRLLLLNEADRLRINVSSEELEKSILQFPPFLTEGNFNPVIFNNFRQGLLPSLGISYRDFEQMMCNDLRIQRAIEVLTTGIFIDEKTVEEQLSRNYGICSLELVEIPLDVVEQEPEGLDDILRPIYESRKEQLLSPETRIFEVVRFTFDPEDPLSRLDARDKAVNFSITLLDDAGKPVPDFATVAQNANLVVEHLGPLKLNDQDSDEDLAAIAQAGFNLTKESPDSNAIEGKTAFFIARLKETGGREQLTYEQSREQLKVEHLRQQSLSRTFIKARELREKIVATMSEGKSFREAAEAQGLQVNDLPRLVVSEAMDSADITQIRFANSVSFLSLGEVSQPQPFDDKIKLIYLKDRKPAEEPESVRASIREKLYRQARDQVLSEWLASTLRGDTRLDINL